MNVLKCNLAVANANGNIRSRGFMETKEYERPDSQQLLRKLQMEEEEKRKDKRKIKDFLRLCGRIWENVCHADVGT